MTPGLTPRPDWGTWYAPTDRNWTAAARSQVVLKKAGRLKPGFLANPRNLLRTGDVAGRAERSRLRRQAGTQAGT